MGHRADLIKERKSTPEWKERSRQYGRTHYRNNKEACKKSAAKWNAKNPEKIKEMNNSYQKRRRKRDPEAVRASENRYYENNKEACAERDRAYRANNKDRISARDKAYQEKNSEKLRAQRQENYQNNKEEHAAKAKVYYQNNKPKITKAVQEYKESRIKTDPLYAAIQKFRKNVASSFERIKKNKPTNTQKLLGCTWKEARAHFEELFKPGMTWENHGSGPGKWNIDHIKPVAEFGEDELHLMNLIENLQPLWYEEHREKTSKETASRTKSGNLKSLQ